MSASDFSGRLLAPVMTRPRRPLSNSASTDSCSIRFSLRTMMSGARSSMSRLRRLLRLMTQRAQLGRDDRDHGHDHPLGPVAGLEERLDDLEPLDDLLGLQLAGGLLELG